jgi:type I restriction enzyme S subunit
LGEIADVVGGVTKDSKRQERPGLVEVPYLRVANVQRGRIDLNNVATIRVSAQKAAQLELKPGDVLLNEGGDRDKLGRGWIWQGEIPGCIHQNHVFRARIRDGLLDPRLLSWYANEVAHKWFEINGKQSVNLASISLSKIRTFPVPVPPAAEQQRMVGLLEDYLSRLDVGEGGLEAAAKRCEAVRASMLNSLVVGSPVTLGQLAIESGYGTSTKCDYAGGGPPVVRIPNIVGGRIDLSDQKRAIDPEVRLAGLMLAEGDLLIVRTNGSRDLIGRSAVVQPGITAAFASYLIRFRLDRTRARPDWVRLMLETQRSRRILEGMAASSAGQYNLGLTKLNVIEIPCPSLEEQDRVLAQASDFEWAIGSAQSAIAKARLRSGVLQQALLEAAFIGRLTARASDMDRVEEMAGV